MSAMLNTTVVGNDDIFSWIRYKNKNGILTPDKDGSYQVIRFMDDHVVLCNVKYGNYRTGYHLEKGLLTFRYPVPCRAYDLKGVTLFPNYHGRYHIDGQYPFFHVRETGRRVWMDVSRHFHYHPIDYVQSVQNHTQELRWSWESRGRCINLTIKIETIPTDTRYFWKVRGKVIGKNKFITLKEGDSYFKESARFEALKFVKAYNAETEKINKDALDREPIDFSE